jgi:peroxiredoxin
MSWCANDIQGNKYVDFSMTSLDGERTVKISDYVGKDDKPVCLVVYTSYMGTDAGNPMTANTIDRHARFDNDKAHYLLMCTEGPEAAKTFAERHELQSVDHFYGEIPAEYQRKSVPHQVVIETDGNVKHNGPNAYLSYDYIQDRTMMTEHYMSHCFKKGWKSS